MNKETLPHTHSSAVIYGAGGHARELLFQLRDAGVHVIALVDEFNSNRSVRDTPVLGLEEALDEFRESIWHVAIGDIVARSRILSNLKGKQIEVGGFISKNITLAPTARVASTAQIFSGCVISDGCEIGEHVIINFNTTVSHDVKIGDETIISPRVAIAGNVSIGRGVFLGVGAVVKNGKPSSPILIGDGAVVGAGACVIRNVHSSATVAGVPARNI